MIILNEPAHDKTYNKFCATSEDSDQPAHPRSLIRVFADRMGLLQPSGIQKEYTRTLAILGVCVGGGGVWGREGNIQADLSLCWSHSITKTRLFNYIENFTSKKLKSCR